MWLKYLKENNPAFKDITIDQSRVVALPENGEVAFREIEVNEDPLQKQKKTKKTKSVGETKENSETQSLQRDQMQTSADRSTESGENMIDEGPCPDPIDDIDIPSESFVPHIGDNKTEHEHIMEHLQKYKGRHLLDWPEHGDPVNEFDTPYLFTKAFPCLFPDGKGDLTCRERVRDVKLSEYISHVTKIGYKDPITGRPFFPFASHPRCTYFFTNMKQRHTRYNNQTCILLAIQVTKLSQSEISRTSLKRTNETQSSIACTGTYQISRAHTHIGPKCCNN